MPPSTTRYCTACPALRAKLMKQRFFIKTGNKAAVAAPIAVEFGLPEPDVRSGQTLQALRRIRLVVFGQTVARRGAPWRALPGDFPPPTRAPGMLAGQ